MKDSLTSVFLIWLMDHNSFFLMKRLLLRSIFGLKKKRSDDTSILIYWFFSQCSVVEYNFFLCNRKLKYTKIYYYYYF